VNLFEIENYVIYIKTI